MVTYDFYKNTYLGSALTEVAFKQAAARAEEWLAMLERTCRVEPCGPDSRAMAVCAVAETMAAFDRQFLIARANMGGVSVTYEADADRKRQRQLLQNAGVYLDICRGVG